MCPRFAYLGNRCGVITNDRQQEYRGGRIRYVSWVEARPNPAKETFFHSDLGGLAVASVFLKEFRLTRGSGRSRSRSFQRLPILHLNSSKNLFESVVHHFTRHRSSQRTQYASSGLMDQQLLALFSLNFWPFSRMDKRLRTSPKPACRLALRPC